MVDPEFDYGDEDEDEEEESESDEDEQEEPNNNNARAINAASNVSVNSRTEIVTLSLWLMLTFCLSRTMPMKAQGREPWRLKRKSNWPVLSKSHLLNRSRSIGG